MPLEGAPLLESDDLPGKEAPAHHPNHFSGHGIIGKIERKYIAKFFNLRVDPWTIDIFFTITLGVEAHIKVSLTMIT